jgi:hypothetical protein
VFPDGVSVTFPEIIHVLGVIDVNGLDIRKDDAELVAIYPNAVLMEHSCLPNTKHCFDLTTFAISVKAAVEVRPGDHISTMYTHALWGTAVRRRHLWTTKHFWCNCKRLYDVFLNNFQATFFRLYRALVKKKICIHTCC